MGKNNTENKNETIEPLLSTFSNQNNYNNNMNYNENDNNSEKNDNIYGNNNNINSYNNDFKIFMKKIENNEKKKR